MNKKRWVNIFWVLLVIYMVYSVFISNEPLWVRVLGLVIVMMWGTLTPIIGKKREKNEI